MNIDVKLVGRTGTIAEGAKYCDFQVQQTVKIQLRIGKKLVFVGENES